MVPAFLWSLGFRIFHKNIWLVCERKSDARDNGYWFFRFLCEKHTEIEAVYAIDFKSPDYQKVATIGKVIKFGGFFHWVYYFSAKRNISSQKEGKPNAALCFILEVYFGCRKNRAYIRHGITKDDQKWVYYDVTKMNLFVCSVKREYDFVKEKFGYPEGNVQLVGLCRFDNLLSPHNQKKQIIVMPTMREWLRNFSSDTVEYENVNRIKDAEYFVVWNSFLQNPKLNELLKENDINLIFFPHASLQKYINYFSTNSELITIAKAKEYDVQDLLMESAYLITDYSSVYFDFAYMGKSMAYYQFDYEKYRKGQYQEGYFSYIKDGFGPVLYQEENLIKEIEIAIENNFKNPEKYESRIQDFFTFKDNCNCERTYQAIKDMH